MLSARAGTCSYKQIWGYIPHHQYTASLMRSLTSERTKVVQSSQVAGCVRPIKAQWAAKPYNSTVARHIVITALHRIRADSGWLHLPQDNGQWRGLSHLEGMFLHQVQERTNLNYTGSSSAHMVVILVVNFTGWVHNFQQNKFAQEKHSTSAKQRTPWPYFTKSGSLFFHANYLNSITLQ